MDIECYTGTIGPMSSGLPRKIDAAHMGAGQIPRLELVADTNTASALPTPEWERGPAAKVSPVGRGLEVVVSSKLQHSCLRMYIY